MAGRITHFGVVLILVFSLISAASARETTPDTDVYRLGEVVISGERPGVEAVAVTREITAEDIKDTGARTLDEAIAMLPGVVVRTGARGVPRIDIRGFRSRHIVLLLNGVPMNPAWDGQFDPSLIPVENIARIKISYGNASVLYGDNGMAGVINVVTKKGRPGIRGSVSAEAGEGPLYRGDATFSGGKEKFDLFIGASALSREAFRLSSDFDPTPYEDGGARENSDKRSANFFANAGFNPTDRLQMGWTLNYVNSEYGIPPATVDSDLDPDFGSTRIQYDRQDDTTGLSGQFSINYDGDGPLNLRGWVYFNSLDEEYNRYDDSSYTTIEQRRSYSLESETDIIGSMLQAGYDLHKAGELAFSVNGRQEKYNSDGFYVENSGPDDTAYDNDRELGIYSAGLEYTFEPVTAFGLVLGYGHHWLDKKDDDSDDAASCLIGAYYDVARTTRLRGSYAHKIRFPTIRQLYDPDRGNPELTPESSDNFEAGIEQLIGRRHVLSLTGFYIDVKDFIERIDADFENNDHYVFQGVELASESDFTDNLMVRLGYTYMQTEDKSPDTDKEELQNRPEHKLSLEGLYTFGFGLKAYAGILYLAGQYDYSNTNEKERLNDIVTLNVKFDQALWRNRLHLYVGADNLLDNDYDESFGGYPGPGRYLYAGAELYFSK